MNEDDDFNEFTSQELIHIHKVNRRGRKCETRVVGMPEIFDYKKILKFWKNVHVHRYRIFKPTDVFSSRAKKARIRIARKKRRSRRKTIISSSRSLSKEITDRR
jgi:translation initiation factor 1 (eIF-1/SUI1)